ncbi:MAG: carotenoid biosynthesis protein [Candidatus Dormibacteria bacterium]
MEPLLNRWYAFAPWVVVILVIWRQYGWRRALPIAVGGWVIAFAAEWSSTLGPGVPFGAYAYRSAGLGHDWRILGTPLFDSLSFTWLAFCTYVLAGALGVRGVRRLILGALALVAIDVVLDPVALRGAHWWLGSIYSYPAHAGVWYGVSALNYLGWLVVGLALQLWLGFWLGGERGGGHTKVWVAAVLAAGAVVQSCALAVILGIWPSALLALLLLAGLGVWARGLHGLAHGPGHPEVVLACALSAEARTIRRALGPGWAARPLLSQRRWSCRRHPGVEIWETGVGMLAATAAARLAPRGAAVLVAGVGGACSDDWAPGSSGVGRRVLSQEGAWLELDPALCQGLVALGAGRPAQLGSRDAPVTGAAERRALADLGVDIVEMETAAWIRVRAGAAGMLAALRTVTDTPAAPLGAAARLVAPGAVGPSPARVAKLLLRHPGSLPGLLELGRHQRLALRVLGDAAAVAVPALGRLAGVLEEPGVDHAPPAGS